MSFHSHTSHKWTQNWYLAFIALPVGLWGLMVFISPTVYVIGLVFTIALYVYARKRFAQSGRRIRSRENSILMSGLFLLAATVLARGDYVAGGITVSSDNWMFVLEMALLAGSYLLILLGMFLPTGIEEAAENAVDDGDIRPNLFITGN